MFLIHCIYHRHICNISYKKDPKRSEQQISVRTGKLFQCSSVTPLMMKGIGSRKFVVYLTLTLLYAACIFYLSSQSHLPHGASLMEQYLQRIISTVGARYFYAFKFIIIHFDKLEHFLIFFVFGILLRLTTSHSRYPSIT